MTYFLCLVKKLKILEIVELLILKGALVNAQNEAGKTALMLGKLK
jgi:ankyrin repeat protein